MAKKRFNHSFGYNVRNLRPGQPYISLCGKWFVAPANKRTRFEEQEFFDATYDNPPCPRCARIREKVTTDANH